MMNMVVSIDCSAPPAQPVYFGREGRQLFGWFHPPAVVEGNTRGCLVVMCNPIGYDAICTHRSYRFFSQMLAEAGFAVLRYDHHGTGDSSGSDEDAERLRAWVNDVRVAVNFGKSVSGARAVCLFGVRMGGTIALAAAVGGGLADSLVTWAAFPSGATYLREMRALRMVRDADTGTAGVAHDAGADLGEEAAGYLLTASTVAQLEKLTLLDQKDPPARFALLLARDDIPQSEKLANHLLKTGCEVTTLKPPGYAGMMLDTFDAVVPVEALTTVRDWLSERYNPSPQQSISPPAPTGFLVGGTRGAESDVRERPVRFGPEGQFFGIVTEPLRPQADRARTAILFVSVGSNLHVGPNRMYVTQARALASLGFVCLRMDIGGVGESPPSAGRRENHLYARHSVSDVREAVRMLREQLQISQVVLTGVCSGAYLSYHAANEDAGISSVILINPQTFTWREGDSLELKSRHTIKAMSFYRSQLFSWGTWSRLLSGQINVRIIAAGVIANLRKRWKLRLERAIQRDNAAIEAKPHDVRATFQRLMRDGTNVFLLYSANDGGLNELETQLGENAKSLQKHSRFKFQIVDGADHTFTPLWAQRRLLDLVSQHVIRLYG